MDDDKGSFWGKTMLIKLFLKFTLFSQAITITAKMAD